MTTAAELRELDEAELGNKLIERGKELFNLRFQAATGRLDNNSRVASPWRSATAHSAAWREIELAESAETVASRVE